MSIVINLSPELEEQLRKTALMQGRDINLVVTEILANSLVSQDKDSSEMISSTSSSKQLRPFGLGAGDFIVPDDFDNPLPEDILRDFEGK